MKSVFAFILAALCGTAQAEFITGEMLKRFLEGDKAMQDQGLGYIVGVHDATMGSLHCSNAALTGAALRDMTVRMLADAGPARAFSADSLVGAMLGQAFPCPKDKAPASAPTSRRGKLES